MNLNSNVNGFVEAIKHSEKGISVKIMVEGGIFHEYGNLSHVTVKEFQQINEGDLIGVINGEFQYFVKKQDKDS